MKYKGYELIIELDPSGELLLKIPNIGVVAWDTDIKGKRLDWFHDTVDLHIGRSAERETCEKRIDPEEVAKALYESINKSYQVGPWENYSSKDFYRAPAAAVIACIKKIDPSIISDDINHGVKHKFDREAIARKIASVFHDRDWSDLMPITKIKHFEAADDIISYIEDIVYG
jgi:hypothetical protein